ncbi:MAG: hypothetical protein GX312_02230 [Candidatus Phytoplasma sp.]|nr:hypothetical protein [Phytoplasma sp.]
MKKNIYSALMQGLSYSLVFLVIRGFSLVLSQLFAEAFFLQIVTYAEILFFVFFVAYLCYDIADKPGLIIGGLIGYLIYETDTNFYGIIIYGLSTGVLMKYLKKHLMRLPKEAKYLIGTIWLPILTLAMILPIIYFTAPYLHTGYIHTIRAIKNIEAYRLSIALLGGIFAGLMAYDAGGRGNKTTYLITVLLIIELPILMASVLIGGMLPPLAIGFFRMIFPNKKLIEKQEIKKETQIIMGLSFITEGALPYMKTTCNLRLMLIIGSFFAGAITAAAKIETYIPHGGIVALLAMNRPLRFIIILIIMVILTSLLIFINVKYFEKQELKNEN